MHSGWSQLQCSLKLIVTDGLLGDANCSRAFGCNSFLDASVEETTALLTFVNCSWQWAIAERNLEKALMGHEISHHPSSNLISATDTARSRRWRCFSMMFPADFLFCPILCGRVGVDEFRSCSDVRQRADNYDGPPKSSV